MLSNFGQSNIPETNNRAKLNKPILHTGAFSSTFFYKNTKLVFAQNLRTN